VRALLGRWRCASGPAGVSADGVAGVGSDLNVKCPVLARMLSDPSASVIGVQHRNQLAVFTVKCASATLAGRGHRIVAVDDGAATDGLVCDMIETLRLMFACFDGWTGVRNRAMPAVTTAKRDPGQSA
jgi:putative resolvase